MAIAAAALPVQLSPSSWAITAEYPRDAVSSPLASTSQAAAAATIGAEPGPAYILVELISGGRAPKSSIGTSSSSVGPGSIPPPGGRADWR
ncbi:hypothetical protein I548_4061 [Mycobacterium intracellulare]|nr:hypothetical protein I548_4061 [Mycobacterium intracellulare]